MRDAKELAADVYLPNGGDMPRPTILVQTPYWRVPYRFAGLPLVGFDQDGSAYNFVIVDWRGRFGSTAADTGGVIHRGEDGYDLIDWIIAQPWSDGKVGTWGPQPWEGAVRHRSGSSSGPRLRGTARLRHA